MEEASEHFQGAWTKMTALSKPTMDNDIQIFAIRGTNTKIQMGMKALTSKIDNIEKVLSSNTKSLREVPLQMDLLEHVTSMQVYMAQIQEVNTALTTTMENFRFCECSQYDFR